MKNRFVVKFGGPSGKGINVLGKFLSNALKNSNLAIFAYREYPSIIKGGYASYQIDISSETVSSSSLKCNILACIDINSLNQYIFSVLKNGIIIHPIEDYKLNSKQEKYIKKNNIQVIYLDYLAITKENNAPAIMGNIVVIGVVWKLINQNIKVLQKEVIEYFSKKEGIDLEAEKRCLQAGYNLDFIKKIKVKGFPKEKIKKWNRSIILSGNDALSLGAISAGCKAYYAYPMTPATSILETLGKTYMKTGIIVKQAESEITAIQMVMGSMYMGARAFTATSGGGFDLMTETISCSGMTEVPLVIVLGQRAGSATGVPTYSGTGDIDAATQAGHGEFPRCVMCASDTIDSYELIQEAFNISEVYQIPVILLTEKQISESLFNIKCLPRAKKIQRGLSKESTHRYKITKNGISPRWIPKKGRNTYLTNSDEHNEYGFSTENEQEIVNMSKKRMRKFETLSKSIPNPKYIGPKVPRIVFVGVGSTKNVVLDAMKISKRKVGYLHYKYILPFKKEKIMEFGAQGVKIVLIENNQTGELGKLIKEQAGIYIPNTLNKFDGRPFFVDDILGYIQK
jgi:2-oxoglutarate/2-oxoacid ferredoxin oxidoreductase subunit alpha